MSNINKIRNAGLHALGALALGALALPAAAQGGGGTPDADKELEVIVVTARKREEKLTDVVGSVTALTEERLRDLNIESIDDVAKFTPGLSFSKAFGRSTERPVIRGAANILAGTAPHAESGASYYVNGVYFQGDIQSLDPNLLQRVEVLKGPQSATYGRNAYSGAVNFVFKDLVGEDFDASVKAGLGIFGEGSDRTELTASVRAPLGDNFGVMASFRSYEYGGEYDNLVTGETIGDEGTTAITLGWQWKTDNHNLRMYLLTNTDEDGTRALALQRSDMNNCYPGFRSNLTRPSIPSGAARGALAPDTDEDNPNQYFCGVVSPLDYVRLDGGDLPQPTGDVLSSMDATTPFSGVERDRTVTMLQYTYDFGDPGTLDVNLGLRSEELTTGSDSDHWDLRFYSSGAGSPPEAAPYNVRRSFFQFASIDEFDDTSLEVRFTSNQDNALRWGAGFFNYSWTRTAMNLDWLYDFATIDRVATGTPTSPTRECGTFVTDDCYTFSNRAGGPGFLGAVIRPDVDSYEISNLAIFGNVEYDLSDAHTVGFEARWASEEKSLHDELLVPQKGTDTVMSSATSGGVTTDTVVLTKLTSTIGSEGRSSGKDASETFDSLTYRLSYRWRYSDNGSLYASYATGNKPGGVNNAAAEAQNYPDFEEEESTNIEVGAKHTMLNGRLYLAGSYFINDISGLQLTTPLADTGSLASAVSNQGDAEVSGFELELRALIGDIMDLGFAFTSINPEITQGCDPFEYVLTSGGYLYRDANLLNAEARGVLPTASCDISGRQIPLTSDLQWALDANWAMPLNNLLLTWGGNINFESSKFAQVHNKMETGDAMEIGVHVGITNADETWAVRLVGTNITDEDAPVALTRWADYGQGSICYFFGACGGVAQSELTAEQLAYLNTLAPSAANFFNTGDTDTGSPRAPFMSLRQRSRWVVNFTYNF